jgi:MFS family permease
MAEVQTEPRVYPFRWVVLIAYMLINIAVQIQWLTFAPVARAAEVFYAGQFNPGSLINIDFFALIYMLAYLIVSVPASYVIDTWGIRVGIGIGSVLAAAGALLKGFMPTSFVAVVIGQVILAVAQPFILNAVTALSARWFPLRERGTAAGLAALAQYLGIILVMVVTPMIVVSSAGDPAYGQGVDRMLFIYGIVTAVAAVVAILTIRERPPTPPSHETAERHSFFKGLRHIFSLRDMRIMLVLFFIGLGIFNAVSSMVDAIAENLRVVDSDGMIGAIMLVGGVIGAVVLPILSDHTRKRKAFLVACMAGMVPGLVLLSFAAWITGGPGVNPDAAYIVAIVGSFLLGFFVMSAGPIGFQYAAEISLPAPESTSQGLLLLSGQITGLIFVAGMSMRENSYLPTFLIAFVVLAVIALIGVSLVKESPAMRGK